MNNSNNELKKSLDDRAKSLYDRIIQSQLATPEQIKGCSETEIAQIEQKYEICLPYSYKVFLQHFGRSFCRIGIDIEFLYPSPLLLTQDIKDAERQMLEEEENISPEELLPVNAFVFAMRQGMQTWYFIVSESVEDPSVFYDEGDGNGVKMHESVFDFWEERVMYAEQLFAKRKE